MDVEWTDVAQHVLVVDAHEYGNEYVASVRGNKFGRGTNCVQRTS